MLNQQQAGLSSHHGSVTAAYLCTPWSLVVLAVSASCTLACSARRRREARTTYQHRCVGRLYRQLWSAASTERPREGLQCARHWPSWLSKPLHSLSYKHMLATARVCRCRSFPTAASRCGCESQQTPATHKLQSQQKTTSRPHSIVSTSPVIALRSGYSALDATSIAGQKRDK